MIKFQWSKGSLQKARSEGADVRFVYSPMDCWKIADENKDKIVVFFCNWFWKQQPNDLFFNGASNKKI